MRDWQTDILGWLLGIAIGAGVITAFFAGTRYHEQNAQAATPTPPGIVVKADKVINCTTDGNGIPSSLIAEAIDACNSGKDVWLTRSGKRWQLATWQPKEGTKWIANLARQK